ncbi:hypothetical protein THASP1DRAFT_33309 [Thamnocephalis sphaerospora]|uniref:Succinate dehydrogenase assembly factor 4, mitochondrial n=1 Tax=Thamnocephalis sphaerospora TaxID=78915 RepID=A0A4P9XGW5_9FUNG|nr:hypothetical protein THASP1DRAFT_33309 [Thamnocephalis sphaerospora]|eukprot:RKP04877.1 hypothetical protein THASP1DRAFT_33309 [Thamnocephalis sphaerospora]
MLLRRVGNRARLAANVCTVSRRAYHSDRYARPAPMPLGDRAQQREFEALVREQSLENQRQAEADLAREEAAQDAGTVQKANTSSPVDADGVNRVTGEVGGPKGAEPTRFGDWEFNGRVYDF